MAEEFELPFLHFATCYEKSCKILIEPEMESVSTSSFVPNGQLPLNPTEVLGVIQPCKSLHDISPNAGIGYASIGGICWTNHRVGVER